MVSLAPKFSSSTVLTANGKTADFANATFKGDVDLATLSGLNGFECADCVFTGDGGTISTKGATLDMDLRRSKWGTVDPTKIDLTGVTFNSKTTLDDAVFGSDKGKLTMSGVNANLEQV